MPLPKHYIDKGNSAFGFKMKRKTPIIGIKNMEYYDLQRAIQNGERFFVFRYTIFFLIVFASGVSAIYFGENNTRTRFTKGGCIFVSAFFSALSGIIVLACVSFGDFFTEQVSYIVVVAVIIAICVLIPFRSISLNLKGGIDVTDQVMQFIGQKMQVSQNEKVYGDDLGSSSLKFIH